MKRLSGLVLILVLLVPSGASAQPVTLHEGDSITVRQGDDRARITVVDVVVTRTFNGRTLRPGKRFYLLSVRYRWVKGDPAVNAWDWLAERPSGRSLRRVGTGGRPEVPDVVLSRSRPTASGWVAWVGPADRSRVTILLAFGDGNAYPVQL